MNDRFISDRDEPRPDIEWKNDAAWTAYSRAWPEAICGYEFYHADELAEAKERALAIARGLKVE